MIFKRENGIMYPTSRPLIKKFSSKLILIFSFLPRTLKLLLKTGNGIIIQIVTDIIYLTSWPMIKIALCSYFSFFSKEFQFSFQKRKGYYPNRKWNNFFSYKMFLIFTKELNVKFNWVNNHEDCIGFVVIFRLKHKKI